MTAGSAVRRGVTAITLAIVLLGGALASPAMADNRGRGDKGSDHGEYRGRGWEKQHWRKEYKHDNHYRRPDVYYSAPPVVVMPPRYQPQPGIILNFGFPLYY